MIEPEKYDQEAALDTAYKNVQAQIYHIYTTIEKNNLRFCLKQTKLMLNELRSDVLNPQNYLKLYGYIFDEMKKVEDFMKLELGRGRQPQDIYESVQQCQFVVPRLYLAIISGSIYIEKCPEKCMEIINDLVEQMKASQNPLRGIFTRYFFLQIIKDKLPDEDNIYVKEKGGNLQDTFSFLLKNIEEITRLWIRISSDAPPEKMLRKEKEREDLKPLISDVFSILSSLKGLTIEIYENEILQKLIEIVFMFNDKLSQEYLMECIIRTFPVDYNIKCMEFILLTISKLTEGANIKLLFIIVLTKLSIYSENFQKIEDKENQSDMEKIYSIFPILMRNYDIIMNNELRTQSKNAVDILELNISFIKYTIKCAKENEILNYINHILNMCVNIIKICYNRKMYVIEIDKIYELLQLTLQSKYSIFDMPDLSNLVSLLDYRNMKLIGLEIVKNIINPDSRDKIDSLEKLNKVFSFIMPLIRDIEGQEQRKKKINLEKEQNIVSKLIRVIKTEDPEVLLDIYIQAKVELYEGGKDRIKITYPVLANNLIYFAEQISILYEEKKEEKENENKFYDISKFENDDLFYEFISKIYNLLEEIIKIIEEDIPQTAFRLYLLSSSQINNIQSSREQLEEKCLQFFNYSMEIYKNLEKEKKFEYFSEICQCLLKLTILQKENMEKIINDLFNDTKSLSKRIEQCNGYIMISQLWYQHFKDGKKVLDCINKIRKTADISITNPQNLILYVLLLNKYIYYIDVDKENIIEIDPESIEDLIEIIQNHIITIKTDKTIDASFLPETEKYFKNTLNLIENRKKQIDHIEIYDKINLS